MAAPSTPVENASPDTCFHCGLLLTPHFKETFQVLGLERAFCCPGCLAVCRAIVGAGLDDYYAHRREKAITADAVPEIVERLGFYDHPEVQQSFVRGRAGAREAALLLENIRCPACLWLNEQVLRGLDGVLDVELDYASHHARVRWDPARVKLSEILESIVNIGYVAHPYDPARREELTALQRRRSTERLIFAGVIGMVVMNFAIAGYVMGYSDETGELALWTMIGRWTSLFATTVLLAYPGQEFFVGAWRDLRNRRLGMDVPIVLGMGFAYVGSLHTTIVRSGEVYYDSIAMFVFLVLLARRIELSGRLRAADALDRVGRIIPRLANRVDGAGEHRVLASELRPGDRVRVRPGECVPTDGVLVDSAGSFDESLLTGEALPVSRAAGEAVIGGAANVEHTVLVEVTRDSGDSLAAEIHRLLARGLREAPRYAVLAQRFAAWFVGVVLVVAAATAGYWLWTQPAAALPNTVAVLIVTCPCALALATPVAAAIAMGRFADRGILPVRGDALETLAQCETVVFDKTGTLTLGELTLERVACPGTLDEAGALSVAAALEADAAHPVGLALRAAAGGGGPPAQAAHHYAGEGVTGRHAGRSWRLGKPAFALADRAVDPAVHAHIAAWQAAGCLVVALADTDRLQALFVLRDQARPGVPALLARLRALGVRRIALLSGDSSANVARFAAGLEFDEVAGDQRPHDKLAWIRAAQHRGERLAMVGDGINDAPTLAAADVSVSFAHASELAQVHSELLVLGRDIGVIGEARALARRTRRIIRQNLGWAASYNLLAVPAAAAGLVPPWGAAIGMSLSSLLVVVNALRLRRGAPHESGAPANFKD
jgi:Cu2+-exporting ATPase